MIVSRRFYDPGGIGDHQEGIEVGQNGNAVYLALFDKASLADVSMDLETAQEFSNELDSIIHKIESQTNPSKQ